MLQLALIQSRFHYLAASQRQVWFISFLHRLCQAQSYSRRNFRFKTTMSSDDAYSAFLDQANQDTGASKASTKSSSPAETKTVNTDVPALLQNVERFGTYTSEADEPFEPVSLKWGGDELPTDGSPSLLACIALSWIFLMWFGLLDEFKDLIGHGSSVEKWNDDDFDPEGKYEAALGAVREAGDGSAWIFRVELGRTRVEYYIVTHDKKSKRVVGVKAKSVES